MNPQNDKDKYTPQALAFAIVFMFFFFSLAIPRFLGVKTGIDNLVVEILISAIPGVIAAVIVSKIKKAKEKRKQSVKKTGSNNKDKKPPSKSVQQKEKTAKKNVSFIESLDSQIDSEIQKKNKKRARKDKAFLIAKCAFLTVELLLFLIMLIPNTDYREKYINAQALIEAENFDGAVTELKSMGSYGESALANLYSEHPELAFKTLKPLDVVKFGVYEQNGMPAPIEWIVISNDGKSVKMISKKILDAKAYNSNDEEQYLENWLNNSFKEVAFSEKEKSFIQTLALPSMDDSRAVDEKTEDDLATAFALRNGLKKEYKSGTYYYFWWTDHSNVTAKGYGYDMVSLLSLMGVRPVIELAFEK